MLRTRILRLRSKSKVNSQRSAHNAVAKVNVKLESKHKTMKAKHLYLAIVTLVAVGGLWFAWSTWRTHAFRKSNMEVDLKTPHGQPKPDQMLRPPNPARRFTDFTPEQRVQFARQGHGPGG